MTDSPLWASRVQGRDDCRSVALSGELDFDMAYDLQRLLIEQLDRPDTRTVVADLSEVTFLDSAALGALLMTLRHASAHEQNFTIAHVPQGVRRILQVAGVYGLLSGEDPRLG
ncbi:STAS domain-containing protein [Actinoplanes aureus]|uniref:Anti-sigma factor antagonist n=1 Tax=Actinoplanes aureus TaxID=2792083 RepID=A0A931CF55_9ACTN|nr:STAS domain-containing protein [Actinoplanes aureus]MBG0563770.1 STAS domain-containing protein [Actinoplanes aureus]